MGTVKDMVIIGAGGTSLNTSQIIEDANSEKRKYNIIGFLDDDEAKAGKEFCGYPVIGKISDFLKFDKCQFIVSGFASDRDIGRVKRICHTMGLSLDRFETIVHPAATVSKYASLGQGSIIAAGVRIMPEVKIGNHVYIAPNCYISHHIVVHDFTFIANSVSTAGGCMIGEGCYLGANSSIIGGIRIGANSLIGIGAVVLGDVEPGSVMVGNPAKLLRRL